MKQEFLKLYDESVDEIFEYCYQKTGDRELSKSITEHTFAKMWDCITPQYPLSHVKSLLEGIASHLIRKSQDTKPEMRKSPYAPVLKMS